jgi:hypothetical protein
VGTFGGGFVINAIQFTLSGAGEARCQVLAKMTRCPLTTGVGAEKGHVLGVDAFALVEAGLEFDIDHVLIDLVGEGEFQSTGNLTNADTPPLAVFGGKALANVGPAIRVGYRFW